MWCWVWFMPTEPKKAWLNNFHQYCHKITRMAKHNRRMLSLCSAHKRWINPQNSKQIPHCFAQTRSTKVVAWTKCPRQCHHITDKEMAYKRLKKAFIYHKVIYLHVPAIISTHSIYICTLNEFDYMRLKSTAE